MNQVILMGRLTRDANVTYTNGENQMCVARFTLAVDRRARKDAENTADFISCVAFGKTGEFIEKYTHKGTKLCLNGRIQTGSYTNKDGQKVYTTDVVVDQAEFAESKNSDSSGQAYVPQGGSGSNDNDFMNIPEGTVDDLPFN